MLLTTLAPSALERLQRANPDAEIWWDSVPGDFARFRDDLLGRAPDERTRRRWRTQLGRFLTPGEPGRGLVRGATTNPSLIAKSVLSDPRRWAGEVRAQAAALGSTDPERVYTAVYEEAARGAARTMLPQWEHSDGKHGWVSVQVDPRAVADADRMLEQGLRLAELGPNVMVKVPGSAQGYRVIRELVGRGVSVNNTFSYTVPQFTACFRAVREGLAVAEARGARPARWRAVVTHMIGRFGAEGDLREQAERRGIELDEAEVRWAEVEVLRTVQRTIEAEGHPVKMLLSSLEVDRPRAGALSPSMHLDRTAGADVAYTCKPSFIAGLMERDREPARFESDGVSLEMPDRVRERLERLPYYTRALDPAGMAPEEFCGHGAFVSTYAENNRNTRALVDFIAHQLDGASTVRRGGIAVGV